MIDPDKKGNLNSSSSIDSTPEKLTKTKTIYVTAGTRVRHLQQKFRSGQGITIIRKVNNEESRPKYPTSSTLPVAVSAPLRIVSGTEISSSSTFTARPESNETDNANSTNTHGSYRVKSKALALKVNPFEKVEPAKAQVIKWPTNKNASLQNLQNPTKVEHSSKELCALEDDRGQKDTNVDNFFQQQQKPSSLQKVISSSSSEKFLHSNNSNQSRKTHFTECKLLKKEPFHRSNSGITSNTVKVVHAGQKPIRKTTIPRPPYTPTMFRNHQMMANSILIPCRQKTAAKFPMSSLFSLNLKNMELQHGLKQTPNIQQPEVVIETDKTPDYDDIPVGLNAMTLQNGLQKALSLTPFPSLLDDDQKPINVPKPRKGKKHVASTAIVNNEKTDFARSKQIIDEQLAKVSGHLDGIRSNISSNKCENETEDQFGNVSDKSENAYDTSLERTQKYKEKATPIHANDKHKDNDEPNLMATKLDKDFDQTIEEEKCCEQSLGQGEKSEQNGEDVKRDENDSDSFELKILDKVFKRILPKGANLQIECLENSRDESFTTPTCRKKKDRPKKRMETTINNKIKERQRER